MNPYLGQISIFAGNFAPKGWALCNGQLISIQQNAALFSLLGTSYGGDGIQTFALPNLLARAPIGAGQGPGLSEYALGQTAGQATHTLTLGELPSHSHALKGAASSGKGAPAAAESLGSTGRGKPLAYASPSGITPVAMNAATILQNSGNQPHNNMPPYLGLTFIIALLGVFPTRS